LGKSTSKKSKKTHQQILNNIQPTEVPKEFIDSITVTFSNNEVVPFNIKDLKGNFSLEEVQDFLKEYKATEKVSLIEIALDLDYVTKDLEEKSNTFLNKYFEN
jgi:hypothetical protein